ncbi:hypothetical protein GX50_01914 [[Emmonsia] crescens]|uniref:Uncharacterized protein n=1 Tax=[Emmonsia] crescens TaxID=73230 RepID=A0A2B7ZPU1_9EURO|nr:hypothetical protein GX50_01914 [Emmonsia crescens]
MMKFTLFQRVFALFLALLLWAPHVLSSPLKSAQLLPRQEEEESRNAFHSQCGETHFCQSDREHRPNCVETEYGFAICDLYYSKGGRMLQVCRDCVLSNCDAMGCNQWFG